MAIRGSFISGKQASGKTSIRRALRNKSVVAALLLAAAAASAPAYAADTVADWGGSTSGNWSVAGNWTTSDGATLPPNTSTTDAVINSSNSTVALDSGFVVGALTLGSTDILNFNNNTDLTVNGTITNAGQININSSGNTTQLIIGAANVNLTGGGTITLSDNSQNEIFGSVITNTLTNVNNLIQGAGNIGLGDLVLNNQGTINANATNNALIIEANGATNTGILEATTTLDLDASTFANAGGTIKALNGGNVNLESGVTIAGGTLTTVGTGVIHDFAGSFATLDGSTNAITNSGTYQIDNNSTTTAKGSIINTGTIHFASVGNQTELVIGASTGAANVTNVSLSGGGNVTMTDNASNLIEGGAATNVFTNVDNTISGAGTIGGNQMALVNEGTIDATGTNILYIQTSNGTTNTGLLEATTLLHLDGNAVHNTGGTIEALNGGIVYLQNSVTIDGGTLTTAGTGVIHTFNEGILDGSANTVTNNGNFQIDNNTAVKLLGTIINNGNIQFASIGNDTDMAVSGTVNLQGSGTVTMGDNTHNRIYGFADVSTSSDTLNIKETIQGAGQIGLGVTILNNQSTINANATNNHLLVTAGGTTIATSTNTGTMEASGGAVTGSVLEIAGTWDNTSGHITALNGAGAGGTVLLDTGSVIENGTLTANGNGTISPSSNATIQNLTITGTGTVSIPNNTTLTLVGTITNNSTIQLNSIGNLTDLSINGDTTLKGTGIVTMGNDTHNRIYAAVGTQTLTLQQEVQGSGDIGSDQMVLANQSTINANSNSTVPLLVWVSNPSTNSGTMEASSGSTLQLQGTFDNTGGLITALNGGTVLLNGASISNGTLNATGTGVIAPNSSIGDAATLTNVTLTGTGSFSVVNNSTLTLVGTITNNSTIALNSSGNLTDVEFSGDATLKGTGIVTMSNNGQNRIYENTGAHTLTLQQEIQGAGQVGAGQMILANQSTINANDSVALIVSVTGTTSTNTGTMEASSGSTLQIAGTLDNTSGLITALNGGTVLLNGASISNGTLNATGTGVISPNPSAGDDATLTNVTITGTGSFSVVNNSTLTLIGTTTNNGTIGINSSGNTTDLIFSGSATLKGTGMVVMSNNAGNRIYCLAGTQTLTLQQEIQGAGQVGVGQMILANQSTIDANDSNALIVSVSGTTSTNTGTMEASSGSTLQIAGTLDNTGGLITALNGGTVLLNGASISNGTLNATGTGVIAPNSNSGNTATLTNLTITGTGSYSVVNNSTTTLNGTITNESTIGINSGGNQTDLIANGDVTLQGGGTVTMSNNSNNRFYTNPTGTLTNVNNLIQGSGQLGVGITTIINDAAGTVSADQSNQLIVSPGASGVSNLGTFQATNGATLTVNNDVIQVTTTPGTLTAGTWIANASSTLAITTTPAPVITNDGVIVLNGAGSAFTIGGVSVDTTLLTNVGELHVMGGRTFATVAFTNSGLLQLGGFGASTPGNGTFTATSLTNFGTIEATGMGNVLTVTAGITDPINPTIQVDANSSLDISGGGVNNATGQLTVNGTMTLGSNNVTVGSDYSNANFGTGNTFNKHANISPATASSGPFHGAILAAGTPGTSITNQTVAFNNVHVGSSNSLSYTINNTGTGGPDVLFAIQPTANGGTISDASLTGAGVTSSNVGPIADGNNSGPLAVNWNPTADGPVGGATAQKVHIANNFDNIAESNVTITGTGWNLASAVVTPTPVAGVSTISFGNFHVGDAPQSANFTVKNNAPNDGFSEKLDATLVGVSGNMTLSGAISLLPAGSTNTNSVGASFINATAGAKSVTASLALTSDGQAPGTVGNSGLGTTSIGSITLDATAGVYNLASVNTISTPVTLQNIHVGGTFGTSALSISNTGPAGSFTEGLNATPGTATSSASVSGSITNLSVASSPSTAISVGLANANTSAAGAYSGTVPLSFGSNGLGTSNLGVTPLPALAQTITVQGGVYNLASANTISTPVTLPNIHVGGTFGTSSISISNTAPAGSFTEGLNATAGTPTGDASVSGSPITNLSVASSPSTAISVGLANATTSTAGPHTGTVPITFASNGTIDGLTNTPLTAQNQTVTVQSAAYRLASPTWVSAPAGGTLVLGSIMQNSSLSVPIPIQNNVTADSYSEYLNGSVKGGSATGAVTGSGSFADLAPGQTSSAINAVINTATLGPITGSIALTFASDGGASGANDGLGLTTLTGQDITVSATGTVVVGVVYGPASASPATPNPATFNLHVGDTVHNTVALSIQNTATSAMYSGTLSASMGAPSNGTVTATGSFTGLAPLATDNTDLVVGIDTSTAGAKSGTATLTLNSVGAAGSGGVGTESLPSQTLTITGNVYRLATVNTLSTPINLGIIHVTQSFGTAAVGISNTQISSDAFSEGLDGTVTGTTPDATSTGSVTNLAAGSSSSLGNQITVGLGTADTTVAGAKTGTVTIGFSSDGATTSGLGITPLTGPTASQIVTVNGQVNQYAQPAFHKTAGSGTLSNDGTVAPSYELDFGSLSANASGSATLSLENLLDASSPSFQDSLDGALSITSGSGMFTLTNIPGVDLPAVQDTNPIVAGSSLGNLDVSFSNLGVGTYDELLTLTPTSTYSTAGTGDSSLPSETLDLHLVVTGVSAVPEPTSLGLLALGGLGLLSRKRRRASRR